MDRKGQTALEYLLILVVALSVVVTIMVWMQASQSAISQTTTNNTMGISCSLQSCNDDTDCSEANSDCPFGAICDLGTMVCKLP